MNGKGSSQGTGTSKKRKRDKPSKDNSNNDSIMSGLGGEISSASLLNPLSAPMGSSLDSLAFPDDLFSNIGVEMETLSLPSLPGILNGTLELSRYKDDCCITSLP